MQSRNQRKPELSKEKLALYGVIIAALITAGGAVLSTILTNVNNTRIAKMQWEVPISLTQTAEANISIFAPNTPQAVPGTRDDSPILVNSAVAGYGFPTHTVQPGDTVGRISAKYGVSIDSIVFANGLYEPNILLVGYELSIPGVVIGNITGRGSLQEEAVLLVNPTNEPISLFNWSLSDNRGHTYHFGQVKLFGDGAGILLYTSEGTNTAAEFFWGLDRLLWESGSVATLRDHNLNTRSQFIIP